MIVKLLKMSRKKPIEGFYNKITIIITNTTKQTKRYRL